jgi:PAS domain S-box-containing protein
LAQRPLRQRLLRQFLLIVLLPLTLLTALGLLVLLPALMEAAEQRNLRLAIALRDQVEEMLGSRLRTTELLADRLRSGMYLAENVRPTLQSMLDGDLLVQAAYLTDERGVIRDVALRSGAELDRADLIGLDQSSQPHYRAARTANRPQWSETFLSIISGRIAVVLAVPAGTQTLMIEVSLDELSSALKDMGQDDAVQAVVLDRSGRVIGHPRLEPARRQESLAHLPLVARAAGAAGEAGADRSGRVELDGAEYLGQLLPVETTDWSVLVAESMHNVLAPLRNLVWVLVLCVLAAFASAAGLAWWLARRAGDEVNLLTTAAQPAADHAPLAAALRFETAEFAQLWQRLSALFQEIREREALAQTARLDLQAVLDAATEVAIVATGLDGTVRLFSRGACKLLGHAEREIVGRATPLLWHDPQEVAARGEELARTLGRPIEGIEAMLAIPRHAGYEVRDWTFVRADGSRVEVSLAVTGIRNAAGDLTGFLGVAIDITERRKAAALEVAGRAAAAASQAKSDFLSRMSHELRSPLNAMLGYAQLMEIDAQEPPSAGQRARLQQVQRAGWHLVELIDEVLDLARIESGKVSIALVPVDVVKVIGRAVEIATPQVQQHGITLAIRWASSGDDGAAAVLADETRLTQVLVNLLSNAAKYNRPNGRVDITCESWPGSRFAIRVRDTGRGMGEDQLARLFEPFNRLGREGSGIEGTGIGLVITRHLVQAMQGELEVESRLDEGSVFTVVLPLAAPAPTPDAPQVPASAPTAAGGQPRARVVYIEDNAVNATLMRQILRQRPQVELAIAATAAEGLALLRATPADLLLLDVHLPDATGVQVLASLAADETLRALPVLVVSADATHSQVDAALSAGARGYLTKPLNVAETLAQVDRLLGAEAWADRA